MNAAGLLSATFLLTVLANGLWQAALLAGAAWLVLRVVPGASATTRHAVLVAALVGAIVLPVVTTAAAFAHWAPAQTAATNVPATTQSAALPRGATQHEPPSVSSHVTLPSQHVPSEAAQAPRPSVVPLRPHVTLPALLIAGLAIAWAVCALALIVRLVLSLLYLERLKRDALPLPLEYRVRLERWDEAGKGTRDVRLCRSADITVPIAVGIFDAMILLPEHLLEELPPEDLDRVLLHELAHLRRGDDWINAFERVAEAIFFFNPGIRWLVRQLDVEREVACDDWVLGRRTDALPYAQCLVKLVESVAWPHQPMVAPGVFVTRRAISIRIERLLAKQRDVRLRVSLGPLSAVAAVAIAVCLLGAYVAPSIASGTAVAAKQTAGTAVAAQHTSHEIARSTSVKAAPWHARPAMVAQASPAPTIVPSAEPSPTIAPNPHPRPAPQPHSHPHSQAFASTAATIEIRGPRRNDLTTVDTVVRQQGTTVAQVTTTVPTATPDAKEVARTVAMNDGDYITEMANAGYPNLSVDQLIQMKSLGVTPEFVREMAAAGFNHPSVDELVKMRALGLTPDYVHDMRKVFPSASLEDLLSMRAVGVTPDYVASLRNAGIGPLNADNVRGMRAVGVTPDYLNAMKAAGVTPLSGDNLRNMRAVGVTPDFVHEINAAGYSVHNPETLSQLRAVGVDKDFLAAVRSHGWHNLTLQQLIQLRTSGVLDQ
jgi:beta-lactamase regulating signal transducer with metallopeptidase domain